MFKTGDIVRFHTMFKDRMFYTTAFYKIISIDTKKRSTVLNLSNNKKEIIHLYYLANAEKEYRKEKLNTLNDIN